MFGYCNRDLHPPIKNKLLDVNGVTNVSLQINKETVAIRHAPISKH